MSKKGQTEQRKALQEIATHMLKQYYPQYRLTPLTIKITPASDVEYAHVDYDPKRDKSTTTPFEIPENTFDSPAQTAVMLGHEIVHQYQMQRKYKTRMDNLDKVVTAFWELEASTWEVDSEGKLWDHGANRFGVCLTEEEKKSSDSVREDWKEQVNQQVGAVLSSPRAEAYRGPLERWIGEDVWAREAWSQDKDNKGWKDRAPAPK